MSEGRPVPTDADESERPALWQSSPHFMPDGHLPVCSYLAVPVTAASGALRVFGSAHAAPKASPKMRISVTGQTAVG